MLTKTTYLTYTQCPKAYWLHEHQPSLAAPPDPSAQRRLRAGQEVDTRAREQFPEGILIPYRPHPEAMAPLTAQAIADGAATLFQATFTVGDLLVKADILTKTEAGWHLIEVKSTTSYKAAEHLPDAAFQVYILKKAGYSVNQVSLMHLNKPCRHPTLSDLFTLTDITSDVLTVLPDVETAVSDMRTLQNQSQAPEVHIGRHCNSPRVCSFHDYCWQKIKGLTIYDIPRLNAQKEQQLQAGGMLSLADIPAEFPLSPSQRSLVEFIVEEQTNIDRPAIQQALAGLVYPLYFFDFETIDHAIPAYDGCAPYQQTPFQYSCHILHEDGRLEHCEYLHTTTGDPRPELVAALLEHIGPAGHIIAYHIPFERTILRQLAEAFPQQAGRLTDMVDRLWDQLDIFRKHYRDYRFGKSNSLKSVLPVVVPELSYQVLDVQNGAQAQVVWEAMIGEGDTAVKSHLIEQLRAYCRLDTLAMVEIHRVLSRL
jgi:predicted RecB family nuclease